MSELATLGGGCFWCLDAFYRLVKGIDNVVSGYSGGTMPNPTDRDVYWSDTGHAEVVQLTFDPKIITYREILEIFFVMHDPTTLNRQGPDIGDEYRSVIFYHTEEQKKVAQEMIKHFATKLWTDPVVTQLEPYKTFYSAADYHQNFYNSGARPDYCTYIINPKLKKFRQKFASKLKA